MAGGCCPGTHSPLHQVLCYLGDTKLQAQAAPAGEHGAASDKQTSRVPPYAPLVITQVLM